MADTRSYRGPITAVIFDWAGTTVDYGSRAPAGVFIEVFSRHGVTISIAEAREPMGMHKRDHIATIVRSPEIAARWRDLHGRDATDDDIDAMYQELIPLTLACLRDYAALIPGTIETIAFCRGRGWKIGSTTGYNREMMDVLAADAARQGYQPDCAITGDDVPAGRPHPYMCFRAAIDMQCYPMSSMVKIGDTVPDIAEGLNAGMWTIAVTKTGNELGLSEKEVAALAEDDLNQRLARARARLSAAGAHYVVESVANVPPVLGEIADRLARGEHP
jgi:phosphonoacetaldehyde hydrolase